MKKTDYFVETLQCNVSTAMQRLYSNATSLQQCNVSTAMQRLYSNATSLQSTIIGRFTKINHFPIRHLHKLNMRNLKLL